MSSILSSYCLTSNHLPARIPAYSLISKHLETRTMFGTTPVTAWELEAERRRELAMPWRLAYRPEREQRRRYRPHLGLRQLVESLRQAPPAGWEDVRT